MGWYAEERLVYKFGEPVTPRFAVWHGGILKESLQHFFGPGEALRDLRKESRAGVVGASLGYAAAGAGLILIVDSVCRWRLSTGMCG